MPDLDKTPIVELVKELTAPHIRIMISAHSDNKVIRRLHYFPLIAKTRTTIILTTNAGKGITDPDLANFSGTMQSALKLGFAVPTNIKNNATS